MSDTINLPYYPSSNRTFGVFADVDGSKANTATVNERALLVGQIFASGTFSPNVPVLVESLTQVALGAGVGSMLYEMVKQYRLSDNFGELWVLPIADPAGVAATGLLTLTGASLGTGILSLYVGAVLLAVPVLAGDTLSAIAARLVALIVATPDCPVTAANVTGVVTFTAKHVGLTGSDIDIRVNYLGALGGEQSVTGLNVAIVPMSGGAGVPVMNLAQAALTDQPFDFVGMPYTDTSSLTAWDLFFNFATGRWSWVQMIYGGYFTAAARHAGHAADLRAVARNSPNVRLLPRHVYDCPAPMLDRGDRVHRAVRPSSLRG